MKELVELIGIVYGFIILNLIVVWIVVKIDNINRK